MNRVDSSKKRLLIIGPYPPPYGGVSVHIKRLENILWDSFKIDIVDESPIKKDGILNIRAFRFWSYLLLMSKADIVHIHSSKSYVRFFNFMVSFLFRKKIIITLHSYSDKRRRIKFYMDKLVIRYSDKIVYVSKEIALRFQLKNSYIKEAFIPAVLDKEELLPKKISDWLTERKKDSNVICCANAWRLDKYNNEDLYGLDLCIEAAKKLKYEHIKVSFIFVISDKNGELLTKKYQDLIQNYNLNDCFFIYESPVSFLRLIAESDIVLRPTNTDGDALTIREGLFLKKAVIASDVVVRPKGTITFTNRNIDTLVLKIKESINGVMNKSESPFQPTYQFSDYLRFYKETLYS